jgi:Flp pilus assembly pilin Flp
MAKYRIKQKCSSNKQSGQGLIEYLLIVALVAIAAISSVQFLSQNLRYKLTKVAGELGADTRGISVPKAEKGMTAKKNMKNIFE